jgi:hypothetical protein
LSPVVEVHAHQGEDRTWDSRAGDFDSLHPLVSSGPVASVGPLVPADEMLVHQIADTFATVSQSDRSWTEKIWAMAADREGSIQIVFGLGVYPNRGVTDAFGGVSRGVEQWTARASARIGRYPGAGNVGPFRYEVVEPLNKIHLSLDANPAIPVAFDWVFDAAVPPVVERREQHRGVSSRRVAADVVRYHQVGTPSGWVDVEGSRTEIAPASWVTARDHSWGVRYGVGSPVEDAVPEHDQSGVSSLVMWCPLLCERSDGSHYAIHWYYQRHSVGSWSRQVLEGGIELPGGSRSLFKSVEHRLEFRPDNRRFVQGDIEFELEDGKKRSLHLRSVSETGFHLGAGLYLGYEGHWHGQWRGEDFLEGEHHADCTRIETARSLHQLRDCVVEVHDPAGGGVGWGTLQSIVTGEQPDMGLTADGSFF